MERNERSQLELFNPPKNNTQTKTQDNFSLLGYIRNYEKIILFIICFIITGIISFSFGVEKGREYVNPTAKQRYDLAVGEEKTTNIISTPEIIPQKVKENIAPEEEKTNNNYTIQIASFKNKESAQKEAETLRKNGFTTLVLPKGSYNVVCVGNFENREKAENLLTKIRKKYHDGFIRRL
ncbi:MAG: SPOR domain-containing protein [Candidatus Omnitrophota bacterium]